MNTITTTKRSRPSARLTALALAVGVLAIPSSVSAFYGSASDNASGSAPDNVSRNAGLVAPDHTSLNASLGSPVTPEPDRGSPSVADPSAGYSSLNAISGSPADEPTFVSGSPSTGDQFDWADAALGAGVAMALFTLGGAALVTVRRRIAVSPTA
jgi:hypothetical protein